MNDDIIVSNYINHNRYKQILLDLIEKDDGEVYNDGTDIISKTDFFNKKFFINEQTNNLFKNEFENHLHTIFKNFSYNLLDVRQIWYQVYEKNNIHNWHPHAECHWTNVYLLHGNMKTEIKNIKGELINYDAQEGDIITFPSYLYHRSPINTLNDKRVIISFNGNFL